MTDITKKKKSTTNKKATGIDIAKVSKNVRADLQSTKSKGKIEVKKSFEATTQSGSKKKFGIKTMTSKTLSGAVGLSKKVTGAKAKTKAGCVRGTGAIKTTAKSVFKDKKDVPVNLDKLVETLLCGDTSKLKKTQLKLKNELEEFLIRQCQQFDKSSESEESESDSCDSDTDEEQIDSDDESCSDDKDEPVLSKRKAFCLNDLLKPKGRKYKR